MGSRIEEIETAALRLPPDQRALLAERLVASLDEDPDLDALWVGEIRRRVEQLRSGAVAEIPGDQVFDELKSLYR